jgi:pyruvate dehydrogenase E1 component alpha subunit
MPRERLASFEVMRLGILDEKGEADEALLPGLGDSDIKRLYELLVLTRSFDEMALSLQREGRLGTYPSTLGQEAAQVGSAYAIAKTDWIFPSFREIGVYASIGYPLRQLFQYWAGDERGSVAPPGMNVLPTSVSVGTHIPHAVGLAMAAAYRRERIASVAYFGEGATSKGDFHEAMNIAGVFKAPVVFICQNNQWAISLSRDRQSAVQSFAQKAIAYGIEGIQVDGNDVFAVYEASRAALEKARSGGGPTFIECLTYRISHHTTSDDSGRYRDAAEVEQWKRRDPIARLVAYMKKRKLWTEAYGEATAAEARRLIDAELSAAEAAPPPSPLEMMASTFAQPTPRLACQMEELGNGAAQ